MKQYLNIRNILILLLLIIVILGIFYKYYEWKTIKAVSQLYNSSWREEFSLITSNDKHFKEYLSSSNKLFGDKANNESFMSSYEELIGKLKLLSSIQEEYIITMEHNKKLFEQINTSYLMGDRKDIIKKIIDNQLKYYDYELKNANYDNARSWMFLNVLSAAKDKIIADKFSNDTINDPDKNIPKLFTDISTLSKYTNNNFKFEHEDSIKELLPYSYEILIRFKEYFSTYYSVMEDFVNGDSESVLYKLPKLETSRTKLVFDFDAIFEEGNDKILENTKFIIRYVADQIDLIKKFKQNGLYKYPLLEDLNNWVEDLVLCQMYSYKSTIYHSITSKYINSKNINDLLVELSSIPPQTTNIDKLFNKNIMRFTNNDKEIIFNCSNDSDYNFTFETIKSFE